MMKRLVYCMENLVFTDNIKLNRDLLSKNMKNYIIVLQEKKKGKKEKEKKEKNMKNEFQLSLTIYLV